MSLTDRDARFCLRRKTDVADFHRFDSDAPQNELALDRVSGADVDDLAVARERGDGTSRRAECPDVVIDELRRRGRLWHRRRHGFGRRLRHRWRLNHNLRLRWRRWWRRFLVSE